jgi:hypothetical protein
MLTTNFEAQLAILFLEGAQPIDFLKNRDVLNVGVAKFRWIATLFDSCAATNE